MPAPHVPALLPHVALDPVIVAAFILLSLYEWRWYWPRVARRLAAGESGVRARAYLDIMVAEWAGVALVLGLWIRERRPWSALRLGPSPLLPLALGFAVVALYLVLALRLRRKLMARPERLARIRSMMSYADVLIPRTPAERGRFTAVALTAGICEEILCRGFMLWYFGAWGVVAAVLLSSAVFGLGHLYLGVAHVFRTSLIGVVFALLTIATGSLVPAIALHVAMDWVSGDVGYRAHAGEPDAPAGATSSPA